MRRWIHPRCIVTLFAVVLLGLALACGPSAPAGQGSTPSSETEATPTPTPEAAPELPEMSPKLQPLLYARFVQDAMKKSSKRGATGQGAAPETIEVQITTASAEQRPDVLRFLSVNGVARATTGGNTFIIAEVPVLLLPRLVERSDVDYTKATSYPYDKLDDILNNDAALYEAGLLPTLEEAVVWVSVHPKAGANFDETRTSFLNIRKLLKDNEAYFMTAPEDIDFMMNEIENKPAIRYDAIIPVSLLPTLAQHLDAGRFEYEGGLFPVSYLHRPTRERIQWHPTPSPESRRSVGPSGQSSSQRAAPSATPSAAAAALGADTWHDAGITGDGGTDAEPIKVGIIDVGFSGYDNLVGLELPSAVKSCVIPNCAWLSDHGTAVAEAVADIAPGASFYLADSFNESRFRNAVNWIKFRDVGIIVHALGWHYEGPGDGTPNDSDILQKVGEAITSGIVWVNAAGNEARSTWFSKRRDYGTSLNPSGNFPKTGDFIEINRAVNLQTSPGATQTSTCNLVNIPSGGIYYFHLRWEDDWGGADTNLDFYLTEKDSNIAIHSKAAGQNIQNGQNSDYPKESFKVNTVSGLLDFAIPGQNIASGDYCLRVKDTDIHAVDPDWIQLQAFGGPTDITFHYSTPNNSIINPAESSNSAMLAVGAAHINQANPARPPTTIATYSSRGPLPIGSAVKPDVVGVANVASAALGSRFSGTSQAAPHVAGMAALVIQAFSGKSPADVADYLRDNALDRGSAGADNIWGHGFAQLPFPAKPTGLQGTSGDTSILLDWDDADNALGYEVMQWDGRAGKWRTLPFRESYVDYDYTITFNGSSATVRKLTNGVAYSHSVRSIHGPLQSDWVSSVSTAPVSSLPTPTGLTGSGNHRSALLDWNDVANATAYEVQQWDGQAVQWRTLPFRESHVNYDYTISFNGSSAVVSRLTNDVSYSHRVRAVGGSLTSTWTGWITTTLPGGVGGDSDAGDASSQAAPTPAPDSGSASGQDGGPVPNDPTPTPPLPENNLSRLTATVENGAVTLTWLPGTNPNYVKQVVKRREPGVEPAVWTDFELDPSAGAYTDTTVESGKTYIYRVKGLKPNDKGGESNRAVATIP